MSPFLLQDGEEDVLNGHGASLAMGANSKFPHPHVPFLLEEQVVHFSAAVRGPWGPLLWLKKLKNSCYLDFIDFSLGVSEMNLMCSQECEPHHKPGHHDADT